MKLLSVSDIKRDRAVKAKLPREGSYLRECYDLFLNNRGVPIRFVERNNNRNATRQLQDYYGLDIRCIEPGKWVLAGEWFGKNYVDYIAAVIGQDDAT